MQGQQTCVPALLEFLSMIPDLTEAAADGGEGSVLTGCERDTKHLAFKTLTFLQQVGHNTVCSYFTQLLYVGTVQRLPIIVAVKYDAGSLCIDTPDNGNEQQA